jgi:hypothetical protein
MQAQSDSGAAPQGCVSRAHQPARPQRTGRVWLARLVWQHQRHWLLLLVLCSTMGSHLCSLRADSTGTWLSTDAQVELRSGWLPAGVAALSGSAWSAGGVMWLCVCWRLLCFRGTGHCGHARLRCWMLPQRALQQALRSPLGPCAAVCTDSLSNLRFVSAALPWPKAVEPTCVATLAESRDVLCGRGLWPGKCGAAFSTSSLLVHASHQARPDACGARARLLTRTAHLLVRGVGHVAANAS